MELTPDNKTYIDPLSYEQLLSRWRFAPTGDPWFQDPTGRYWGEHMAKLRDQDPGAAVAASKRIGRGDRNAMGW